MTSGLAVLRGLGQGGSSIACNGSLLNTAKPVHKTLHVVRSLTDTSRLILTMELGREGDGGGWSKGWEQSKEFVLIAVPCSVK